MLDENGLKRAKKYVYEHGYPLEKISMMVAILVRNKYCKGKFNLSDIDEHEKDENK